MHLADTAKALIVLIALSSANSAHAIDPVELTKLTPSTQRADQRFGAGVSVSGDTIVVGNEGAENADGANTGSILVFTRDQDNITLQAELFPSDGLSGYAFGRSVVIQGDTILVGVENADQASGAVYVYVRNNGLWTEQAKLTVASTGSTMSLGHAVDLDGDTAIISAAPADPQNSQEITAYVFVRNNGIWTEQQQLILPERSTASLGSDVAVSGDTVLLTAIERSPTGYSVGAFYVYVRQGNSWTIQAKVIGPDRPGSYADYFGVSLDLEGDTAVAGDLGIFGHGTVYVFERAQEVWSFSSRMEASDGFPNDLFSNSLDLSGDVIVAGAYNQTQNGDRAGAAYVFVRENGTWAENAILLASDGDSLDRFGSAVAIDGSTIIVAAENDENDTGSPNNTPGSAYVFGSVTDEFSASPTQLDFGAVRIGQNGQQSIVVQNLSTETITVAGSAVAPFSVLSVADFTIASGESSLVDVQFSPSSPGLVSGILSLSTQRQNTEVALSGEGVAAAEAVIDVSSLPLEFPDTVIGETSLPINRTVSNIGDAILNIGSVTVSGDLGDYVVDSSDCTGQSMLPGNSCILSATFTPSLTGDRNAEAVILSNAANGDQVLTLSGNGLSPLPIATIRSQSHQFDTTYLGESSDPAEFIVTNTGGSDLVIGSLFLGGTNPDQFKIVVDDDSCSGSILTRQQGCEFSIKFQPTLTGGASATLELISNDPDGQKSVALSGVAVTYDTKQCTVIGKILKKTECNLLTALRSSDYFGIPRDEVADDVLFEYIKNNSSELEYLVLQIDFGRDVQGFLLGAPGLAADEVFFDKIKYAGRAKNYLTALNLVLLGLDNISRATFDGLSVSLTAFGKLVEGIKVFRRFEIAIREAPFRQTLSEYIENRRKPRNNTPEAVWQELVQVYFDPLTLIANLNGVTLDELATYYENAYAANALVGYEGESQSIRHQIGLGMASDANAP